MNDPEGSDIPKLTRRPSRTLPASFTPNKYTVLCGRGSVYAKSSGNMYLKHLVRQAVPVYAETPSRNVKSEVVTKILLAIHQESPQAAFVKYEEGAWQEVDDSIAREKIGTLFRDLLHDRYKSSNKAKVAKRSMSRHHAIQSAVMDPEQTFDEAMTVGGLRIPTKKGRPTPPFSTIATINDERSSSHYEYSVSLNSSISFGGELRKSLPPILSFRQMDSEKRMIFESCDAWSKPSFTFLNRPDGESLPTASVLVDSNIFGDIEVEENILDNRCCSA
jgi:hypothetical protein